MNEFVFEILESFQSKIGGAAKNKNKYLAAPVPLLPVLAGGIVCRVREKDFNLAEWADKNQQQCCRLNSQCDVTLGSFQCGMKRTEERIRRKTGVLCCLTGKAKDANGIILLPV